MSVLAAVAPPHRSLHSPSFSRSCWAFRTTRTLKTTPEPLPAAYFANAPDGMLKPVLNKLMEIRNAGNRPELAPYFNMVDEMLSVSDEIAKLEQESAKLERNDISMKSMFNAEVDSQLEKIIEIENRLFDHLHTRMSSEGVDCATWHAYVKDASDCTVEIRPGVGGVEAGKWCKDIFDMLERFAGIMGWAAPEVKVMEQGWQSGYRQIIADFFLKPGVKRTPEKGIFGYLKFEAGIHRVQRVPSWPADSLPQTSACSVVVLPREDPNSNLIPVLKPHEYKVWITKKSSGPGGQCVNAAHQAVRIRHIESGVEGFADCYRALKSNKALALQQVSQKIMEEKGKKIAKERGIIRKQHMGSGDRSEKIRSYNYLNGTVVDHRLPKSEDGPNALEEIMDGEGLLHDIIEPLRLQEYRQRVQDYVVYEL